MILWYVFGCVRKPFEYHSITGAHKDCTGNLIPYFAIPHISRPLRHVLWLREPSVSTICLSHVSSPSPPWVTVEFKILRSFYIRWWEPIHEEKEGFVSYAKGVIKWRRDRKMIFYLCLLLSTSTQCIGKIHDHQSFFVLIHPAHMVGTREPT